MYFSSIIPNFFLKMSTYPLLWLALQINYVLPFLRGGVFASPELPAYGHTVK